MVNQKKGVKTTGMKPVPITRYPWASVTAAGGISGMNTITTTARTITPAKDIITGTITILIIIPGPFIPVRPRIQNRSAQHPAWST